MGFATSDITKIKRFRVVPVGVAGHPAAPMKGETKPEAFTLDFFAKVTKNKNACVFEVRPFSRGTGN